MKRIIAMFMVLCIFFSSNICYVQASEYEFVAISIIDGINSSTQEGKKYSVIRVDNDLMFSGEDLAEITGFEYEIKGQQATFKRGYKEVKINLKNNKYTAYENLGYLLLENKVLYVNSKYYYPGAEILPWLNVVCLAKENKFCIIRDEISYWDFVDEFDNEIQGLEFDFITCCNELDVNSKWLKVISYAKDRGVGGAFQDILWIPGSTSTIGGTLEYMDILEEMLADGDRIESASSELQKKGDVLKGVFDVVAFVDESDGLPDELQVMKKASDAVTGASIVVDMGLYSRLLKQDTTERLMWVKTISGNRYNYSYPDALVGAAMNIASLYDEDENFDDYFDKFIYTITDDVTEGYVDALTGKGLLKGMLSTFGLYSKLCPDWNEGINRIGKYNEIAKYSKEAYCQEITRTHICHVESRRANAMLFLYATEHNWQVMADYAKDKGKASYAKKYEKKAKEALRWQGVFLVSSSSTVNDSHEYKDNSRLKNAYVNEIRKMFNDIMTYEISGDNEGVRDFINQIENDIILSLLKETEVSVSGYKIMDLNGDGTEEIILSTRSEQNTQDSFYVIDKKSDTHIYEYTRFLAAGTNSLYVDEKNNDIYILQEYTTIGTQTQDIYKWNNCWEHIAHSEAMEMNWHTFEWGQNTVSEEEWNAKLSEIKKCTKWKNNDISTNSLEFEFGVNELFEQYKNYLKENKLEYITYEEDVDANGSAEKCIEIENYLWIYNKSVSSEFDTELPNVFTYGLYQPVTKIVLSGSVSSCKASVLLDKNRFSTKSGDSDEKLKEYLMENIWYSYQPMLGDYYVYKFDKDGTFKLEMVDAYGVTEFYGERNYTVENGKVTLEEDGWSYIWEYNNGILNTTVYFKDDPMYGTYTLHMNLVPSKNEISIVNDKFRLYYNQIVAS